jgi:nucleotide-binding universal stress UspA family protein
VFRTVVVTTDFSANSTVAIEPAVVIAEKFGARVVLVHVLETPQTEPGHPGKDALRDLAEMSHEHLEEFGKREIGERVPWSCEIATGPAYLGITEVARRHGADLIVVATRGRTGVLHLLLGSVAARVVRTATCPVLTVRAAS